MHRVGQELHGIRRPKRWQSRVLQCGAKIIIIIKKRYYTLSVLQRYICTETIKKTSIFVKTCHPTQLPIHNSGEDGENKRQPTWTRCGGGRRRLWVFFWQAQRMISSRKPRPRKPVPAPMIAYLLTTEPAGNPVLSESTTTAAGVMCVNKMLLSRSVMIVYMAVFLDTLP